MPLRHYTVMIISANSNRVHAFRRPLNSTFCALISSAVSRPSFATLVHLHPFQCIYPVQGLATPQALIDIFISLPQVPWHPVAQIEYLHLVGSQSFVRIIRVKLNEDSSKNYI